MSVVSGFLLINKPNSMSSFSCVSHIKRVCNLPKKTKVGHAGTLDPFATGLLIIGIGREATRKMNSLITLDKVYIATGKLGERTDTLDRTGHIIETADHTVTHEQLKIAIASFSSGYVQTPPLYSALKYQGLPLYAWTRKELITPDDLYSIAQQKKRPVTVHSLELINVQLPYFTIRSHVSHGTYIRSLVNDIAVRAGSCATTYELQRIAIGPFHVDQAHQIAHLTSLEQVQTCLLACDLL